MDLTGRLEERRNLVIGGVLLVTLSALALTSLRSPVAFDPFWHLQMGKDWIENGLSPWVDHYSYTFHGAAIANPPVMFQAILHWLESAFGLQTGFALFRLGSFLLIIGAAWLLLRQIGARAVVYAVVLPMLAYLLQLRAYVRPELISHVFTILALMLYFRAEARPTARHVLPMALLMLAWTNYHTSIVGYVIFFGFFLDCAVAQAKTAAPARAWFSWLAWGALIIGVGFLNAGFTHPLLDAVSFPSEWTLLINEYLPPSVFSKYRTPGIFILILLAMLVPAMALKQRRIGFLAVWAVLAYAAFTMQRFVTPSGIVIVMLAACLVTFADARPSGESARSRAETATALAGLFLAAILLYLNVERARYIMEENRNTVTRFPDAMVNYMDARGMSGPLFNDYGLGGYLIYRLSPRQQVYIDGRTQILYPLAHLRRYLAATESPSELRTELETHGVDRILWRYNPTAHDVVHDMGGFGLDFVDAYYALYVRGPGNFPLLGRLLSRPACWRPELVDDLNAERRRMDRVLPGHSVLFPFANFVTGYANAVDGATWFDASFEQGEWSDNMRRFAGYRFLEAGRHHPAVMLFGGIEAKKAQDFLASAMAMLALGNAEITAQILREMSEVAWPRMEPADLHTRFQLYNSLGRSRPLTPGEQVVQDRLRKDLAGHGVPDRVVEPVPAMLCGK